MKIEILRKAVKKLIIDAELDKPGCLPKIAEKMDVNYNSLNMALSGYRTGPKSVEYLKKLQSYLVDLLYPEKSARECSDKNIGHSESVQTL